MDRERTVPVRLALGLAVAQRPRELELAVEPLDAPGRVARFEVSLTELARRHALHVLVGKQLARVSQLFVGADRLLESLGRALGATEIGEAGGLGRELARHPGEFELVFETRDRLGRLVEAEMGMADRRKGEDLRVVVAQFARDRQELLPVFERLRVVLVVRIHLAQARERESFAAPVAEFAHDRDHGLVVGVGACGLAHVVIGEAHVAEIATFGEPVAQLAGHRDGGLETGDGLTRAVGLGFGLAEQAKRFAFRGAIPNGARRRQPGFQPVQVLGAFEPNADVVGERSDEIDDHAFQALMADHELQGGREMREILLETLERLEREGVARRVVGGLLQLVDLRRAQREVRSVTQAGGVRFLGREVFLGDMARGAVERIGLLPGIEVQAAEAGEKLEIGLGTFRDCAAGVAVETIRHDREAGERGALGGAEFADTAGRGGTRFGRRDGRRWRWSRLLSGRRRWRCFRRFRNFGRAGRRWRWFRFDGRTRRSCGSRTRRGGRRGGGGGRRRGARRGAGAGRTAFLHDRGHNHRDDQHDGQDDQEGLHEGARVNGSAVKRSRFHRWDPPARMHVRVWLRSGIRPVGAGSGVDRVKGAPPISDDFSAMPEIPVTSLPIRLQRQVDQARTAFDRGSTEYAINICREILRAHPGCLSVRRLLRATQLKAFKTKNRLVAKGFGALRVIPALVSGQAALRKNPAAAIMAAERALHADPSHRRALRLLAEGALALDLPETAIFALESVREQKPDDRTTLVRLAQACLAAGRTQEGLAIAEGLTREAPDDAQVQDLLKHASVAQSIHAGGWDSGSGTFRDKLRDEQEAISIEQAGKVVRSAEMTQRQVDEAIARIRIEPGNLNHYRTIVEGCRVLGKLDQAINWLERARKLPTGAGDMTLEKLASELRLERAEQLVNARTAAVTAAGGNPAEDVEVARLRAKLTETRVADLRGFVEKYPNDSGYKFELGRFYEESGQVDLAIQQFQVVQRSPRLRLEALMHLGRCFQAKRHHDLAVQQFATVKGEITTFNEQKKEAVYQLGCCYEAMGNGERAVEEFKLIYSADIGFRDVAEKINRFYAGS